MDPYEVPAYYVREQSDKFYLLPWTIDLEMGVLALICNSLHQGHWVLGDGDNNRACLHLIQKQAIKHLGAHYDFPFITYFQGPASYFLGRAPNSRCPTSLIVY